MTLKEYESHFIKLILLTKHSKKEAKLITKLKLTRWVISIEDDLKVIFGIADTVKFLEEKLAEI